MDLKWTELAAKYAKTYQINSLLVMAIIQVESGGQCWAMRHEPGWKLFVSPGMFAVKNGINEHTECIMQATSFGLMQCMGAVARELGFKDPLPKLCFPELGVMYGCLKIHALHAKYNKMEDIIASYNHGHPEIKNGSYVNQSYVNKVMDLISV